MVDLTREHIMWSDKPGYLPERYHCALRQVTTNYYTQRWISNSTHLPDGMEGYAYWLEKINPNEEGIDLAPKISRLASYFARYGTYLMAERDRIAIEHDDMVRARSTDRPTLLVKVYQVNELAREIYHVSVDYAILISFAHKLWPASQADWDKSLAWVRKNLDVPPFSNANAESTGIIEQYIRRTMW